MSTRVRRLVLGGSLLLLLAAGAGAAVQLERPIPAPIVHGELASSYTVLGSAARLPWPTEGQAALYLSQFGWLGATGTEGSVPVASVTKIMTALVVLRAHPLTLGMAGPTVAVSAADFSLYQSERAVGDSVVPVEPGEIFSELQLLEGLLLPSGDNLAVLLADWQAGSEAAFVEQMDQLAVTLHLDHTRFADSSGLDPGSVSCARDLVALATVAMRDPVFASIVAMPTVTLPLAGVVHNYNPLLGKDGVIGVKTGWTEAAMGCLVFAASESIDGHPVQLIGAVLGQPGGPASALLAAGQEAAGLLASAAEELHWLRLPAGAAAVGWVTSSWAHPVAVGIARPIPMVGASGARLSLRLHVRRLRTPLRRGVEVGTLTVATPGGFSFRERVVASRKLGGPSWWWRLTRPF